MVDRIAALTTERDQIVWDVAEYVVDREQAISAAPALREKDLEAMILATWYGLAPEQAASVMGCSVRAFNVRLHRARKRLEAQLRLGTGRRAATARRARSRFAEDS